MDATAHNTPSWSALWRTQVRAHPLTAAGFALAGLGVMLLLVSSVYHIVIGEASASLRWALLGGTAACAATAVGALPGVVVRNLPQRIEDSMLGFAAGMMLAASSFSLILPGLEAANTVTGSAAVGALVVVLGMALGVLLMLGMDQFTPHEHCHGGPCGPGHDRIGKVWLFVMAIALHNLPEGMAIGVGFAQGDQAVGLPLTMAIALQDMPEGLAVVMALRSIGLVPSRAVMLGAATGLMEPLGSLLGFGLSSGLAIAYPLGLGLSAGAMIWVVSHEVIPETHRNGHQTPATIGLMLGFAVMMVLDTVLG